MMTDGCQINLDWLDTFILQAYEDSYDEIMPTDKVTVADGMMTDNMEPDEKIHTINENVMKIIKKAFRRRLTNRFIF